MSDKPEFIEFLESITGEGWHVVTIQLENSSAEPLSLILEPQGGVLTLDPGAKYEVVAQQPRDYGVHLEFSEKYIQVWVEGSSGVFHDGSALYTWVITHRGP
jgi:hypothetical protein